MIDFRQFCLDYRIPTAPPGNKHYRKGWVGVPCPFCTGSPGFHLGLNIEKGFATCYRCQKKSLYEVFSALSGTDPKEISILKALIARYTNDLFLPSIPLRTKRERLKFPSSLISMNIQHKRYLERRKFDPEKLEREYGLSGTAEWGEYPNRIVAPIIFQGRTVSWQARDITDLDEHKYIACPEDWEVKHHKHILYGFDKAKWKSVAVVEGITGVWRLGEGAVATFGVKFRPEQLKLLIKNFERFFLFGDGDPAGERMGDRMEAELSAFGKEIVKLGPVGEGLDSGSIPDEWANEIMKEVRRK